MFTHPRLTDDKMRYYQFKARDQYLLQKEDHDWNEFCKQHKCTCCSCQPTSCVKPQKDIGVQATSKVPYRKPCTNIKTGEIYSSQTSLDDIKKNLENIHITLSELKQSPLKEKVPQSESASVNPALSFESKQVDSQTALNLLNDKRKAILKNSLVNSLKKLHSFAAQKSLKSSLVTKSKNSGYFLPHDLQKQRLIARKAYLASLTNKPKIKEKKLIPNMSAKRNITVQKCTGKPPEKIPLKPRKKIPATLRKSQEPETLMQLEAITEAKDENIEKAVDDIIDDLLGEELLVINKVKQQRIKRKENITKPFVNNNQKKDVQKVSLCQLSPESQIKVKAIPFFNLKIDDTEKKEIENSTSIFKSHIQNEQESSTENNDTCEDIISKSLKEGSGETRSKSIPVLSLSQDLVKNVTRQRKLYWQYLENISRAKTHNFDPVALSNIVSESLLDDCISDVSNELGNIPTSLITDLINLEFTPTF